MQHKFLLGLILVLLSGTSLAGFSTYSSDWPVDTSIPEEQTTTANDPACQTDYAPKLTADFNQYKRLYLKIAGNFNTTKVKKIRNESTAQLTDAVVAEKSVKDSFASWEVGAGTKLSQARIELEYVHTKKLHYDPSPIFNGRTEWLTSELINNAILANLFWDFDNNQLWYFTPYIGVFSGAAWNKTRAAMYNGIGNNVYQRTSRYSLLWGVTVGARIPFWSRWVGYFGFRYSEQGRVKWRDSTTILTLRGRYTLSGFSLGVNFLI